VSRRDARFDIFNWLLKRSGSPPSPIRLPQAITDPILLISDSLQFAFELFYVLECSLRQGSSFFRGKLIRFAQWLIAFPDFVSHAN
jgi:hypothetical protein